MAHDSNFFGNIGSKNGSTDPCSYKQGGASDTQAAEAAAAAARRRAAQQKSSS